VIATGHTHSLAEFVATAFECVGLHWQDHVISDATLLRPSDIAISRCDPAKALAQLGWQAQSPMQSVVRQMVQAKQLQIQTSTFRRGFP